MHFMNSVEFPENHGCLMTMNQTYSFLQSSPAVANRPKHVWSLDFASLLQSWSLKAVFFNKHYKSTVIQNFSKKTSTIH